MGLEIRSKGNALGNECNRSKRRIQEAGAGSGRSEHTYCISIIYYIYIYSFVVMWGICWEMVFEKIKKDKLGKIIDALTSWVLIVAIKESVIQ